MTAASEGVSGQQHAPAALYPRERPSTHFTGGWWAQGPVWTGGKSRPHRDSIPDRPARSQSLYRLSYPAHCCNVYNEKLTNNMLLNYVILAEKPPGIDTEVDSRSVGQGISLPVTELIVS